MNREEILHLGKLARIRIEEAEIEPLKRDIGAVLDYVSVVKDIAGDGTPTKQVGPVHNVFRADVVTNEAGANSELLLKEAPATRQNMVVVKKILNTD